MLIRDVIRNREPYSTKASVTVQEAAEFMAAKNIGAVCVLDEGGKLLGVFSERDVLNRIVVAQRDPHAVRVGDVTSELRAVIRCEWDWCSFGRSAALACHMRGRKCCRDSGSSIALGIFCSKI